MTHNSVIIQLLNMFVTRKHKDDKSYDKFNQLTENATGSRHETSSARK